MNYFKTYEEFVSELNEAEKNITNTKDLASKINGILKKLNITKQQTTKTSIRGFRNIHQAGWTSVVDTSFVVYTFPEKIFLSIEDKLKEELLKNGLKFEIKNSEITFNLKDNKKMDDIPDEILLVIREIISGAYRYSQKFYSTEEKEKFLKKNKEYSQFYTWMRLNKYGQFEYITGKGAQKGLSWTQFVLNKAGESFMQLMNQEYEK